MSNNRKTDAAIGLLGLGKIYPHIFTNNNQVCSLCGNIDPHKDMICYDQVPHYSSEIESASCLLAVLMKEAPYGIDIWFDKNKEEYHFVYHAGKTENDSIFITAKTAPEGIKKLALYHYKIDINQITDRMPFNLQV